MRKRATALLLAALLAVLAFTACTGAGAPPADVVPDAPTAPGATQATPLAAQPYPVTEQGRNPFTGRKLAEEAVAGQRPVMVMVGNNEASRPQRGLAKADLLIETLAEGGITRLMACYGDYRKVPEVGPVRSTRDQFVQLAVPANGILTHIGSSVYAENLLNVLGYQDIDGIYLGHSAFVYDYERAKPANGGKLNEYCWFTDRELVWQGMQMTQLNLLGEVRDYFHFEAAAPAADTQAYTVEADFSDVSLSTFTYDPEENFYDKGMNGTPHTDENGKPYRYKNVILLSCNMGLKEDERVPDYDLTEGTGMYFNRGRATPLRWTKGGPTEAVHLFAEDGTELGIQRGRTYLGFLPAGRENAIRYQAMA